jgi:hypothetical protein
MMYLLFASTLNPFVSANAIEVVGSNCKRRRKCRLCISFKLVIPSPANHNISLDLIFNITTPSHVHKRKRITHTSRQLRHHNLALSVVDGLFCGHGL